MSQMFCYILFLLQEFNNFASSDSENVTRLQELETLCTSLSVEALQELNKRLEESGSAQEAQAVFEEKVSGVVAEVSGSPLRARQCCMD